MSKKKSHKWQPVQEIDKEVKQIHDFRNERYLVLSLSAGFLIAALGQLGEVIKTYSQETAIYIFFMILFISFLVISGIFLGYYVGSKSTESRINKKNPL